ncbi:hypothetical protein [Mammaliicoccus sciuri]|uniref:hypothetical protein n=1 Tax=Mammaliicoccus sciuri TaxID=1296 RepID=UPI001300DE7B|nr:hypothetical protein [Mammaliicoccus sciuri]
MSENHDKDINEEIEKELLEYLENKDEIEAAKPKKKKIYEHGISMQFNHCVAIYF